MKPQKELLERVAGVVLEDAAFVFAMPLDGEPPELSQWQAVGVRLRFAGPLTGYCELWAPFEVAKLLSANMLGKEEDAPDAQEMCFDAMKEAVNILCGNLLTELAGETPVFGLGMPATLKSPEPLPDDGTATEVWLDTEGQQLLFRVRVEASAAGAA